MDTRNALRATLLVGAWDQAEAILDILGTPDGDRMVAGIIDISIGGAATGCLVRGIPVLDSLSCLERHLGAVGGAVVFARDAELRQQIAAQLRNVDVRYLTAIDARATISASATIGDGAIIGAGVVVGAGVRIGSGAILRPGVVIEPGAKVGDFSYLEAQATVGAGARLGERSVLGLRAIMQEGVAIGPDSAVALGSIVTRDLEPGSRVTGSPARPSEPDATHPEFDLV